MRENFIFYWNISRCTKTMGTGHGAWRQMSPSMYRGPISQSNKNHCKTNFQYHHSDLYNDITFYLATTINLRSLWNRLQTWMSHKSYRRSHNFGNKIKPIRTKHFHFGFFNIKIYQPVVNLRLTQLSQRANTVKNLNLKKLDVVLYTTHIFLLTPTLYQIFSS